eukprot:963276-Karenia_brevis.AAC.1
MDVFEICGGEGSVSKMSLRRHLSKSLKNQPGQFWPKSAHLSLAGVNSNRRQRMDPGDPAHQRL